MPTRIKMLLIGVLIAYGTALSQTSSFPPGANGGTGVGAPNVTTGLVAGPATSVAINISSLQLSSTDTLLVQCWTGTTTLTPLTITSLTPVSTSSVTANFSSSSNITCRANSNGGAGTTGAAGTPGSNGNTILNGTGVPSSGTGVNGDFYLNNTNTCLYGPKAAGSWPGTCVTLPGTNGINGTNGTNGNNGTNGTNGTNGNTVLNGTGVPSSGTGANGDFFFRTDTTCMYGPKAAGAWPGSCTSLIGPTGAAGPAPPGTGAVVVTGGVAGLATGTASFCVHVDGSSAVCGSGGGGSVFTGSTAVTSAFTATPIFSLADVSVKSPVRFEPGAMSNNVTSVTFTNKTAGAKFSIAWPQNGTGGFTVNYGANATNTCAVDPDPSITTTQFLEVAADGSTVNGIGCVTNQTGAELGGPELAALGTPATGYARCWFDSTDHSGLECKANSSANIFKLLLTGVDINTVTGQVIATHLSVPLPRNQGGFNSSSAGTGLLRDGTTPTASEVSGDCVTSGSNAIVCTKSNGVTLSFAATATESINPQTATYQVVAADFDNKRTITVASGTFTITLVPSGTQPALGKKIKIINYGSGVVTVSRSGQNINGGTGNLTLAAATATAPTSTEVVSDGTNYFATLSGGASGGSGCTTTGTGGLQKGDGLGGCVNSGLSDDGTTITTTEPISLGTGYLSTTQVAGSTGTTAGLLCTMDSSAQMVVPGLGASGVLGICLTTQTVGQSVQVAVRGTVNCPADNTTIVGNLLGVGTTTGGRCRDLGQTDPVNVANTTQIMGRAKTAVSAGSNVSVQLIGGLSYGTSVTLGGDATGAFGANTVSKVNGGSLPASAPFIGTNSSNQIVLFSPFTTNAQTATYQVLAADFSSYKTVVVASGTFTITLVASGSQPANGQMIKIINYGSGVVTIARSGQNINGGTTSLTLPAGSATAPTSAEVVSNATDYFVSTAGAGGANPAGATNSVQINAGSNTFGAVTSPTSAYPMVLTQKTGAAPAYSQCIMAGVVLTGCSYVKVVGSNLATGDTDLYTCGTGKRCMIGAMNAFNPSGGSITYNAQIKFLGAGSYFRMAQGLTLTTGTGNSANSQGNIILEATDVLSINTTTTAGLNAVFAVMIFDNTAPLKTVKLTSPSTGDNVLYQVPSGGSAVILNSGFAFPGNGNFSQFVGSLYFVADANSRNVYANIYANGGSAGSTNKMMAAQPVSASSRLVPNLSATLGSQDVLSVNVDTGNSNQIFWVNVVEYTQ